MFHLVSRQSAAEKFSRQWFGKIVTGLDGANAYNLTGPGSFGVVVQTDASDTECNLKVLFPYPVFFDTHWVKASRFRLAADAEIQRILEPVPSDETPELPTGALVEFTETVLVSGRSGEKIFAAGALAVVDHSEEFGEDERSVEYGVSLSFSKTQVWSEKYHELSYRQFLRAANAVRYTPVMGDDLNFYPIRTELLRPRRPNPHALDRVVLNPHIKERLVLGIRAMRPEHKDLLTNRWNLGSLPGCRGFVALLYGEPGTGKTTLASALAEHAGRPIIRLKGSDLGADPADFTDCISLAMKKTERLNAILLIEEADQVLQRRHRDMQPLQLTKVSEMLQLLESYAGVLLLTSNRPFLLDRAVQSRLNLIIEMPAMTSDVREAILMKSLPRKLPVKGTLPVEAICRLNVDGRAIKMTVVNAASRAAAAGLDHVPVHFFLEEAQLLLKGIENLSSDAACTRLFEDEPE